MYTHIGVVITTNSVHTDNSSMYPTPTEPGTEVYTVLHLCAWY